MIHMDDLLLSRRLVVNYCCFRRLEVDDLVHGAPMLLELGGALLGMLAEVIPHIVANLQLRWRGSTII